VLGKEFKAVLDY